LVHWTGVHASAVVGLGGLLHPANVEQRLALIGPAEQPYQYKPDEDQ
jgi:hypothetical protein